MGEKEDVEGLKADLDYVRGCRDTISKMYNDAERKSHERKREIELLTNERDELLRRLKTVESANGNCSWFWQDTPDDDLESMSDSMLVIIAAGQLRNMLRRAKQDEARRLEVQGHGPCPLDGWPVPRLELVYVKRDGWRDYCVYYRLVLRHLTGGCIAVPLGRTDSCWSGAAPSDLPFIDGAHMAHDAAHLKLPAFKVMPGAHPELIDFVGYEHQVDLGKQHRKVVTSE